MNIESSMKLSALMLAIFSLLTFAAAARSQTRPLTTVPAVDLNRYSGRWFEIARYPNRFEKDCVRDVTADYVLLPGGKIQVTNTCVGKNGKTKIAKGEAKVVDKQSNSKLKVRFAPSYLSWLPLVWGEYWIVDLDPDYRYALVGDSGRDYFWILSREPQMSDSLYATLLKRAEARGFNPARVQRVEQGR